MSKSKAAKAAELANIEAEIQKANMEASVTIVAPIEVPVEKPKESILEAAIRLSPTPGGFVSTGMGGAGGSYTTPIIKNTTTYAAPSVKVPEPDKPQPGGMSRPNEWNGELAVFILDGIRSEVDGQYIPCIAIADQPGYFKTQWLWGTNKAQAQAWANEYNAKLGLTPEQAFEIWVSTIRAQARAK